MNLQQTDKGQKKPGHKLKMAARIKLLKIIQVLYQQTRSQRTGRVFWKIMLPTLRHEEIGNLNTPDTVTRLEL